MKGIIYCRVSSNEQTLGTSLENQQIACEQYAHSNNIAVEQIFIERGESATAANRTEFIKALDYCNKNKDVVAFIVWKVDRFARNTTDHFGVRAKLIQYGTTLHSVTESISDDPQGQLTEVILAGFAQFENDMRKQRCIAGMQGSLRRGFYIGSPKFGYKREMKKNRRITEPDSLDESVASLIRKGMLLYAEGNTTVSQLARISKEWGLRARTGVPFYKQGWSKLLEDKYYIGILVDPWNGEEYPGLHEPLVSLETYQKIQAVKKSYGKNQTRRFLHNQDFPLRGFIKCFYCDKTLTGSKSTGRPGRYPYYHCKNKGCEEYGHSIRKADLEEKFIEFLKTLVPREEYIKLFEANVLKVWQEKRQEAGEQLSGCGKQLIALETRLATINEMRADGDIDKATHKRMKADVENRIATVKDSRNEAEIEKLDLDTRIQYSMDYIRNIARIWQDLAFEQKLKLQRAVLPEGITYDKRSGLFGTAPLSYLFRLFWDFPMEASCLVAGSGIEPESGGYEPPEVPLL